jgi:predicted short-subunit dehydrogenase-like oxidoreductase (DUF2520 family)
LQTLTAGIPVPHGEFPLIVDGESDKTIEFLRKTAWSISPSVTHLPEVERQALHLAAVFTNNFTNAILAITYKICEKSGLDFNLVLPLLRETIRKVHLTDPDSAQTGPAKRRDIRTIRSQLAQLKDEPGWQELYKQLSLIINPGLDLIQTNTEPEKDPDAPH